MAISENGVSFFGAGGHSHNGINSTLIDVNSYSIFDFKTGYVGSANRIANQQQNMTAMEDWVVRTINSKVLEPAGLSLSPNTFSGKSIKSNTITALQLQANTITADEIAANTITANELVSNIVLVNNTIQSAVYSSGNSGWQISNTGSAEFNNVTVRGTVEANNGNVGGWEINSSYIYSGSTVLYSNGDAVFGNTTIYSNGMITNGGFTVDADGVLNANSGIFEGSLNGADITGASGQFTGSVYVWDGTNGIEITTDGYIRALGGNGVRIKNYDGSTGTKLFAGSIETNTFYGLLFDATVGSNYFRGDSNGARIRTSGQRPLTLYRNYVDGEDFIRLLSTDASGGSGAPHEVGRASFATANTVVWSTSSDIRLKENIENIPNPIDIIKKLNPVKFNFIGDSENVVTGFIAQEVYDVIPSLVSVGSEDSTERPWALDYSGFTPVLTAALKILIDKIEALENRLQALEGV